MSEDGVMDGDFDCSFLLFALVSWGMEEERKEKGLGT